MPNTNNTGPFPDSGVFPGDWQSRVDAILAELEQNPAEVAGLPADVQARIQTLMTNLRGQPWDERIPNWQPGDFAGGFAGGLGGGFNHQPSGNIGNWPGLDSDDTLVGTANDDTLFGGGGADVITGDAGKDRLFGGQGNDHLDGGAGDDRLAGGHGDDALVGGAGNDYLYGGKGNDSMVGGEGSDTYGFGRGGGHDTINNHDTGADDHDILRMGPGIHLDQLTFQHTGNDLVISINGTQDSVTITGWYSDAANKLDGLKLAGGDTLSTSQIDSLVSAMATVTPTPTGTPSGIPTGVSDGSIVPIAVGGLWQQNGSGNPLA